MLVGAHLFSDPYLIYEAYLCFQQQWGLIKARAERVELFIATNWINLLCFSSKELKIY